MVVVFMYSLLPLHCHAVYCCRKGPGLHHWLVNAAGAGELSRPNQGIAGDAVAVNRNSPYSGDSDSEGCIERESRIIG